MSDQWITWESGEMPVAKGVLVDVRHRDGEEYFNVSCGSAAARNWDRHGMKRDIVAYKLSKSDTEKSHEWALWHGGDCPVVNTNDKVDVKLRNETYIFSCRAYSFRWDARTMLSDSDIIAWRPAQEHDTVSEQPEYTGGSVNYYRVKIDKPTTEGNQPYTAECNDIIEALGMNYAEGNAFKAIWRKTAARTLGLSKAGYVDGLYDAEKVHFFGARMVEQERSK